MNDRLFVNRITPAQSKNKLILYSSSAHQTQLILSSRWMHMRFNITLPAFLGQTDGQKNSLFQFWRERQPGGDTSPAQTLALKTRNDWQLWLPWSPHRVSPVAGAVPVQCQLQRWKALQFDTGPSTVLGFAELQIYYRLDVWTEGLTRPGISVWTCSASATLSAGSGGRSAVCKSYPKTLWCLHPAEQSTKCVQNGAQNKEPNRSDAASFNSRN